MGMPELDGDACNLRDKHSNHLPYASKRNAERRSDSCNSRDESQRLQELLRRIGLVYDDPISCILGGEREGRKTDDPRRVKRGQACEKGSGTDFAFWFLTPFLPLGS
jgi:hypothetical protein